MFARTPLCITDALDILMKQDDKYHLIPVLNITKKENTHFAISLHQNNLII